MRYGADKSGATRYRFNSLGFRGEEFDPNAGHHVFVCGASSGFATGVDDNDSWWYRFKRSYARLLGVDEVEVNLLNFSEGGTSCDYISRVLISQSERFRPDLIISSPSDMYSAEYLNDELEGLDGRGFNFARGVRRYAPRTPTEPLRQPAGTNLPEPQWKVVLQAALGFFAFQTREVALVSYLRNALLLQYYCQARSIPYLSWALRKDSLESLLAGKQWSDNVLMMLAALDRGKVLSIDVESLPRAVDGRHPGEEANRRISDILIDALGDLYAPAVLAGLSD